jgi:hypothetical protein
LEAELLGFKDDSGQPTYLINHALLEIPKIGDSRPASVGNYDQGARQASITQAACVFVLA